MRATTLPQPDTTDQPDTDSTRPTNAHDRVADRLAMGGTAFLGVEGVAFVIIAVVVLAGGISVIPIVLGASGVLMLVTLPLSYRSLRAAIRKLRARSARH